MSTLHLTVAAVVERNGRFLFVEERVDGERVINQPAGHVEPGETLRAAVAREMLEETAWQFSPVAICGIYLWQHPQSSDRFLRVAFCGSCSQHDPHQTLDTGILRALWLSRAELLNHSSALRSPMVVRALDDYLAGQRFPVGMFQQIEPEQLACHAAVIESAA